MGVTLTKETAKRMGRATLEIESGKRSGADLARHGRFPHSSQLDLILITSSVDAAAATLTDGVLKIVPVELTALLFEAHEDNDSDESVQVDLADTSAEVIAHSYYLTQITIASGKGRVGWLVDGRLLLADCTEVDLE